MATSTVAMREANVEAMSRSAGPAAAGRVLRRATPDVMTAIDVGTTKVCVITARKGARGGIDVMGYATVQSQGLRKGSVTDVGATADAIRRAVEQVEEEIGYRIDSAFVGVTGAHVSFQNRRDRISPSSDAGVITADSLTGPSRSLASVKDPQHQTIQSVRTSFSVDGEEGIRNPIGMHSDNIEVETHVVVGLSELIEKVEQAVELAGVKLASMVMEPIASGTAVLTEEEKEKGVVMVDMGGGTTDLVAFKDGQICYTGVIPVAGFQFTNDIAMMFNTYYEAAEDAKIRYGSAELYSTLENEEFEFPVKGQDMSLKVRGNEISHLTRQRAQEIAKLIGLKLDKAGLDEETRSRIVLTGGASTLPGMDVLMRNTLSHWTTSVQVRRGRPEGAGDLPEELSGATYSTGVGMLLWAAANDGPVPVDAGFASSRRTEDENGSKSGIRNMFGLFGKRRAAK